MSITLTTTPELQSLPDSLPSTAGASPQIQGWTGTDVTIMTFVESNTNGTSCGAFGEPSCSFTKAATKTEPRAGEEVRKSRTQTAANPMETDSRLAQLGLVVALLGVLSVVV